MDRPPFEAASPRAGGVRHRLSRPRPGPSHRERARGVPGFDDLDGYFEVDLEHALPPLEVGSVDCIVYADVLPRFVDPLAALVRQARPGVGDGVGAVLGSQPATSQVLVAGILRGLFPYSPAPCSILPTSGSSPSASVMQLLLDAGYAPNTVGRVEDDGAAAVVVAGAPLFELLGVGAGDAERDLRTPGLIVRGSPLRPSEASDEVPVTFVACVNDEAQLDANLRRSPCLAAGGPTSCSSSATAPARPKD